MEHVMEVPNPNEHLLERILSTENVKAAWKLVKANKGKPGFDRVTIEDFPDHFRPLWLGILQSLLSGSYEPSPVLRTEIPKRSGGKRPLGIPIVLDRVIQQAIAQVIGPIFDPLFSEHSFNFRPGRSAHDAVKSVQDYIRKGYRFARYADDFIILVKSDRAGQRVMVSVKRFLEKKLKLKINEKKSCVTRTETCCFLGFTFEGAKIRWSDEAFREFKRRVKELTGRSWFVSMEYRMQKSAEYLRGWMNYFGTSSYYRPIPEMDHWLRRRIRMCYWKQWRRCRTKVRNLLKLGTPLDAAISVGMSRKGPWRLARTFATQIGMTNQWLKKQGLISVKELWVNIHYPATAR